MSFRVSVDPPTWNRHFDSFIVAELFERSMTMPPIEREPAEGSRKCVRDASFGCSSRCTKRKLVMSTVFAFLCAFTLVSRVASEVTPIGAELALASGRRRSLVGWAVAALMIYGVFEQIAVVGPAMAAGAPAPQMVIIDTDIGDDFDDALALGLALSSPELKIIGITSAWGDTALRARMLDRLLCDVGRSDVPVAAGIEKRAPGQAAFTQARWAARQPAKAHPAAVDFLLEQIRRYPGEITLIGIAPLTNLGAAIERDPATFKKLKRIVIMGGSIHRGYGEVYVPNHHPDAEYNIAMDPAAAKQVFNAGVPLYVMPLDATQHKLDEVKRQLLFTASTDLTDDLSLLYLQWVEGFHQQTPTLYDDVAVAYAIDPALCPASPMRVEVDDKGFTRPVPGAANSFVCLGSDSDKFFNFYMARMMQQRLAGSCLR
jgi:purine nucleosidase